MKYTINFGFFLIIFILVKFNILLLNEETLILLVFSVFSFLSVNKITPMISNFFEVQQTDIKSGITTSSTKLLALLKQRQHFLNLSSNWTNELTKLKQHFLQFNSLVLKQWPHVYQEQLLTKITKKLYFSQRLETQLLKLISLIVLDKLKSILQVQKFCTEILQVQKFTSTEKIYLREHLKKID
uniref:ATP synthase F0 subunit b n=1 Tax=Pseudoceramium tenerrimum TaxID=196911 RepID=UPI002E793294|nr:ATP synthase F0 subunit b [Pseudoceramium tenerrimum]WQF69705.1 ATP synthase F0 subunit b [Pseudoceramium tenerrimum]WQF69741.1 ATP synthase F0 subunit b [Pseudoceramium tenerrimum]